MSEILKEKNQQFRGIIIPVSKDSKFGIRLEGDITLLEVYAVLKLVLKQLVKDIGIKK